MNNKKIRRVILLLLSMILVCLTCVFVSYALTSNNSNEPNKASQKSQAKEQYMLEANINQSERTEPEHIILPYSDTIDFSNFDFSAIDRIVIKECFSGPSKVTITDTENINSIVKFMGEIKGSEPQSVRGYAHSTYTVSLYSGDEVQLHVSFMGYLGFATGEYETVGNFTYAALYEMHGVTDEEVGRFFAGFFK